MVRVAGFLILFLVMVSCGGDGGGQTETTAQLYYKTWDYCQNSELRVEVGGAVMITWHGRWSQKTTLNNCGMLNVKFSRGNEGDPLPCGWYRGEKTYNIACGKHNLFFWDDYSGNTVTTGSVQRR